LLCNYEKRTKKAYNFSTLQTAHKISGSGNFNIDSFLKHWPAYNLLKEDELKFIEKIFPTLVKIARSQGIIHKEAHLSIMDKIIYGKHIEGLSDLAIHILAMNEMKKPISERNVVNWGTTIVTNDGFLKQQRQKLLEKIAVEDEKVEKAKEKEINAEIAKLVEINRKEQQEIKILEKENKIENDAISIFEIYKSDSIRNDNVITWKSSLVKVIKNAYTYNCVPTISDKSNIENRKLLMIEALQICFDEKISSDNPNPN
jgi:hypothetical protein